MWILTVLGMGVLALIGWIVLTQNPPTWRKNYRELVLRMVPLGSTKAEFDRVALGNDDFSEETILKLDGKTVLYVSKHPFKNHLIEAFVCAEPEMDDNGRIVDYQVWSGFHFPMFRGDTPYDVYPQPH